MTTVQRAFRWGAGAMGLLALVPGYYAIRLRWVPAADFDVVGVLWVMQNLPRLTAFILLAVLLGASTYFLIRSLR